MLPYYDQKGAVDQGNLQAKVMSGRPFKKETKKGEFSCFV
jgi:hypothetical protein